MVTGLIVAFAVITGYAVTVGCFLLATFAVASSSPGIVEREHRITRGYKWIQALIWLVCATAGGSAAGAIAREQTPLLGETALSIALIGALWFNVSEVRQRGIPHQVLMNVMSVLGVVTGFTLVRHFLNL